jgi:hypothetical protein
MRNHSHPALKQAPSEIASARPACPSHGTNAALRSWVATSVTMATFTGVRMFWRA